jgi:hypothetical protein
MPAGLGVQGIRDGRPWSQTLESWTTWRWGHFSDAGQFPSAGASPLGELRSDGKLAGVTTIALDSGRAEPRGHFLGSARLVTVSQVCGRRNERERSAESE